MCALTKDILPNLHSRSHPLKAIANIKAFPKRIESYSDARSIKGVGDKTALKVRHPVILLTILGS